MTKHGISLAYTEVDAAGNTVYVLVCKCKWKDKAYNKAQLEGTYRHHVITETNRWN